MRLDSVGPDELDALRGELHELYRMCFTEPPWNESAERLEEYPALLAKRLARPGASAVVVTDQSTVVGVAYGSPAAATLPDEPFYRALAEALPDRAHLLVSPALEVIELMVSPRSRGRGVGRALLDRYVAGRTAWLCTHPNAPARRLSESAGWLLQGELLYRDEPRM